MNRNFVRVFIGIVVVVLVGGLIGWWLTRSQTPPPSAPEPAPVTEQPTEPASTNVVAKSEEPAKPEEKPEEEPSILDTPVTAANWEEHLDEILGTDKIDTDQKADKLADMIPKLPEAAQVELAGHLVNLASDEFYVKTATILKDEKTPAAVGEILMNDLFNRDQELMLPIMVAIASNPNHPLKDSAWEDLEMLHPEKAEEIGKDWAKWNEFVQQTVKEAQP